MGSVVSKLRAISFPELGAPGKACFPCPWGSDILGGFSLGVLLYCPHQRHPEATDRVVWLTESKEQNGRVGLRERWGDNRLAELFTFWGSCILIIVDWNGTSHKSRHAQTVFISSWQCVETIVGVHRGGSGLPSECPTLWKRKQGLVFYIPLSVDGAPNSQIKLESICHIWRSCHHYRKLGLAD